MDIKIEEIDNMQLATTVNKPVSKLQVKRFLFEMGGIEVIGSRDKKGFC